MNIINEKGLFLIALSAVLLLLTALFSGLFMLFLPVDYFQMNQVPARIVNEQVRPGESLFVETDFCKKTDKASVISLQLHSADNLYLLPPVHGALPEGCYKHQNALAQIPEDIKPGTYVLHVEITFSVNPLRDISYNFDTEPFIIE